MSADFDDRTPVDQPAVLAVPHGLSAIIETYGDPLFDGEGVSNAWESGAMVRAVNLPCGVGKKYIHRKVEEPLRAALAACEALGDDYQLKTLGCFAPRWKRAHGGVVSTHTWGIAFDVNAVTNPMLTNCPLTDARRRFDEGYFDIPRAWVEAWRRAGFVWGGDFTGRVFDPMHFQLCSGY